MLKPVKELKLHDRIQDGFHVWEITEIRKRPTNGTTIYELEFSNRRFVICAENTLFEVIHSL